MAQDWVFFFWGICSKMEKNMKTSKSMERRLSKEHTADISWGVSPSHDSLNNLKGPKSHVCAVKVKYEKLLFLWFKNSLTPAN